MSVGDMVHYALPGGPRATECRPAVVIRVVDPASRACRIGVFTDGLGDGSSFADPNVRVTAREGEPGQPGRWHERGRCP